MSRLEKRNENVRDRYLATSKWGYELPKGVCWNEVELKVQLADKGKTFGIFGDLEIDNGHSYAYSVMVFFPTYFQTQVIKT